MTGKKCPKGLYGTFCLVSRMVYYAVSYISAGHICRNFLPILLILNFSNKMGVTDYEIKRPNSFYHRCKSLLCLLVLDTSLFSGFQLLFQECPIGTFKNVEGSDKRLCTPCPPEHLPSRAKFVYVRGILSYSSLALPSLDPLFLLNCDVC